MHVITHHWVMTSSWDFAEYPDNNKNVYNLRKHNVHFVDCKYSEARRANNQSNCCVASLSPQTQKYGWHNGIIMPAYTRHKCCSSIHKLLLTCNSHTAVSPLENIMQAICSFRTYNAAPTKAEAR